jgi:HNH endonuclease
MTDKKQCSVCSLIFEATTEYFYKQRNSLHGKCKTCYNRYQASKQNTKEYKEKRKNRLTSNRDSINFRQRVYYSKNKEKLNEYYKQWDKNHPDAALARTHKRRARIKGNGFSKYTREDMIKAYGANCHICKLEIDLNAPRKVGIKGWEEGLHIDHLIPLMQGGPDILENVRPAHGLCNLKKGSKV